MRLVANVLLQAAGVNLQQTVVTDIEKRIFFSKAVMLPDKVMDYYVGCPEEVENIRTYLEKTQI